MTVVNDVVGVVVGCPSHVVVVGLVDVVELVEVDVGFKVVEMFPVEKVELVQETINKDKRRVNNNNTFFIIIYQVVLRNYGIGRALLIQCLKDCQ